MDALTLLRQDHRKLERLLERLERPEGLDHEQHRVLLAQVGAALRQHVDDEGIFYAAFRQEAVARGMDTGMLDTGAQQHRLIGELAGELAGMAPGDHGLDAKVRMLCGQVRSHLDTEDTTLLTAAEDILSDDELIDLGRRIEERKRVLDAQRELADTMRPLTGSRASRFVAGAAVAAAVVVAVLAGRRRPARGRRRRGTVRRR